MLNNGAVFTTQTLTDKEEWWLCCCKELSFFFEQLILKQWGKTQKITNCKRCTILAIESLQLVILLLHWFQFQTDIYLILYLTFQEFPVYFCHHFFQLCFWSLLLHVTQSVTCVRCRWWTPVPFLPEKCDGLPQWYGLLSYHHIPERKHSSQSETYFHKRTALSQYLLVFYA